MKPSIFVTRTLPEPSIIQLKTIFDVTMNTEDRVLRKEELIQQIQGKDALLCLLTDAIDKDVIDAGDCLKVISNYAVGFNNIDLNAANSRKIPVCITPGILTEATADLAWALILSVARRIVEADQYTRNGSFTGWGPDLFLGSDLNGKTLGIIGMGRIGQAVAKRAKGFDMKVVYYSRTQKSVSDPLLSFDQLLQRSDFISLHTPLTLETTHLIGENEFKKMKRSAFLINTTRGAVVDEKALVHALKTGIIAGAGLDVYEHEPALTEGLAACHNAVILPHIGSATTETRTKMAILAVENAIAVIQGKTPHAIANPTIFS
jgi:glyoxylate reductase